VSLESRRLFAETMHSPAPDLGLACLLIALEADPTRDLGATIEMGLAELDRLAGVARGSVPLDGSSREIALGLRSALAAEEGFRGFGDDYADLRASLLPEVLRRKRGLPILLSVVYLEVARRLGVPAVGVGFPGHFVVRVGTDGAQLLDPFYGGRLVTEQELLSRAGVEEELPEEVWRPWGRVEIVLRVLQNIRALGSSVRIDGLAPALRTRALLTARHDGPRFALWATDLALLLPHHPVTLRRERAGLRARLGDYAGAAADLDEFADVVDGADDDAAVTARRSARLLRSRLN
jgi:regulator of sirC expression with transglutaminase-like and TPR domain